jgi:hypothetical protein
MCVGTARFGAGREISEYIECIFGGVHFDHGGGHARFVRCFFRDVHIREWLGQSTELVDCTFSGRIDWAVFCGKIPIEQVRRDLGRERNEFHGNDFSDVNLMTPDFRCGIDLMEQRLPSGPEYLFVPGAISALARVRAGIETWNRSGEAHRIARIWIHSCELIVKQGQKQLFMRPEVEYRLSEDTSNREALDRIFALLRMDSRPGPD